MSKESFIGGDYIEFTGGDCKTFAKGSIINSGSQLIQIGIEKGVSYGTNKLPPPFKEDAKCIVNIRPQKEWQGEFAFDWFREGITDLSDDVDFNEIVGKYYAISKEEIERKIRRENLLSLKDYFIKDPNKWYVVEKDADKNITGAKENFKKDEQYLPSDNSLGKLKELYQAFSYDKETEEKIYYASFLGLFPKNENYGISSATLDLNIEFLTEEKPDYLIFKVDGIEISNEHPIIGLSSYKIENPTSLEKLTIECKARSGKKGAVELFYNTTKLIQIYSVKKQDSGYLKENLAGAIKFINTTASQKKKILIIKVQTGEGKIGAPKENSLTIFEKVLNQCMLQPEFLKFDKNGKEFKLDMTKQKYKFQENTKEKNVGGISTIYSSGYLGQMLVSELTEEFPEYIGSEYFRLYFLETLYKDGESLTRGYSNILDNYGIMFKNHDAETVAHECLHGLGLSHTFFFNQTSRSEEFTFKAQTTKNMMDYSNMKNNPIEAYNRKPNTYLPKVGFYLWYWQWKKVNRNIQ